MPDGDGMSGATGRAMRRLKIGNTECVGIALLAAFAACSKKSSPARDDAAPALDSGPGGDAGIALRPNFVFIVNDDIAALDGRQVAAMPATHALFADRGVTFDDFHSESPLCCPARAGIFSGQHSLNHGVIRNQATLFNPSMTIATQLHSVGYYTMIVGKYLNQFDNVAHHIAPGWDRMVVLPDVNYFDYHLWVYDASSQATDATEEDHGHTDADYSTDVLAKRADEYIRAAPVGQPLFAYIAPIAPHEPTTPAPRYTTNVMCSALPGWSPPNFNEADVSDKPLYVRSSPLLPTMSNNLRAQCLSLLATDDLVATVRQALADTGRLDNTVFVFMGDNGMNMGEHRLGNKQAPYETEIPFYVSWPAQLGTAPRTIHTRVQNIDIAPTLCELGGCSLGPFPNGQATCDGISFARVLLGQTTTLGRDAVIDEMPDVKDQGLQNPPPPWYAVTTTAESPLASQVCAGAASGACRWHYIEYDTGEKEMYDVSNGPCYAWTGGPGDPCELNNILYFPMSDEMRALEGQLAARLQQLKAEKGH
jgi:arylsulfatase A-like enzyme